MSKTFHFEACFYPRITKWKWTTDGCELKEDHGNEAVCACSVTGIFAVTTDMYNDNVSIFKKTQ